MPVSDYFSATYTQARQAFIDACNARGLEVTSHLNDQAKGAEGEDLYMDVARFGSPSASKILFLSCATHGGEGFCGSGIQVGLLQEGFFADLPEDTAVVLIHAINPYGFSHVRRVNEHNIDLNRNFRDYSKPLPDNQAYKAVHDMVLPLDWDGPARANSEKAIEAYIAENDLFTYQSAVSGGQHVNEQGIFYGGKAAAWSNVTLRSVVSEHAKQCEHVAIIDFHTGLGPNGYGELIYIGDPSGIDRAKTWYDNEITSPADGSSSSAIVEGTIDIGYAQSAPDAVHTCIALEYGTVPVLDVLDALRADNWLYIHGDINSDLGKKIKKQVRDAFYCDTDEWKAKIWQRGHETVSKALKGLASS
ncbi:M14 family metallopeptidase [Sneathiella aquimaris]|uniref:M14 family metallopeptidase n=1 Tax=Sneathiella aquimaris TaxID=2599305 RepID=UPI00146ED4DF|nr:M14 family metallopeptidase [Sneathiella aquimaris]